MMDLSIIIVNFNNRKLLEDCLASIYASTKNISFEVIVSDNGSNDGSNELVKKNFPKAIMIENHENLGFSKANNLGLKIYKGRYAVLLNNDTVVKPGAFERMVGFMDQDPRVGACGPKLLNVDGTVQRQGGIFGKKFWLSNGPVEVKFVIGACLMVRRSVIDMTGMLDEKLYFYNEDLDWCIRIRKAGYQITFPAGCGSGPLRRLQHQTGI